MSDHAFDFLQSWIVENINATMYEDKDTAEHLADDCIWEANTRGITEVCLVSVGLEARRTADIGVWPMTSRPAVACRAALSPNRQSGKL